MKTVTYFGRADQLDYHGALLVKGVPTEVSDELASELAERRDVEVEGVAALEPDEGEEVNE